MEQNRLAVKKINIYKYKEYFPQGLKTLLYKEKNINFNTFITFIENYMSEEEKDILFQKIKKEEGIDLNKFYIKFAKETPLFKSVSLNKEEESDDKKIIIIFSAIKEEKNTNNKKILNKESNNPTEFNKTTAEKTRKKIKNGITTKNKGTINIKNEKI